MNMNTDGYQLAPLNKDEQTLKAIQEAESLVTDLTGKEFILIAYEKTNDVH